MSKVIRKNTRLNNDERKELLINDLVEVLYQLGFEVRVEKGTFKGGFCMLREQKVFLLNRNLEQDRKIAVLARNISELGTDGIYLKPSVRELVEKEAAE